MLAVEFVATFLIGNLTGHVYCRRKVESATPLARRSKGKIKNLNDDQGTARITLLKCHDTLNGDRTTDSESDDVGSFIEPGTLKFTKVNPNAQRQTQNKTPSKSEPLIHAGSAKNPRTITTSPSAHATRATFAGEQGLVSLNRENAPQDAELVLSMVVEANETRTSSRVKTAAINTKSKSTATKKGSSSKSTVTLDKYLQPLEKLAQANTSIAIQASASKATPVRILDKDANKENEFDLGSTGRKKGKKKQAASSLPPALKVGLKVTAFFEHQRY
jgi:hypothetical protein